MKPVSSDPLTRLAASKVSAAGAQIEAAITLHFLQPSALAVLTLAHAARRIVRDVLKSRGLPDTISMEAYVKPERLKEFRAAINAPANFLKHADEDPEGELDLHPDFPELILLDAICGLFPLGQGQTRHVAAFLLWFSLKYPEAFTSDGHQMLDDLCRVSGLSRSQFSTAGVGKMLLAVIASNLERGQDR